MSSTSYRNLIEIVTAALEKIAILEAYLQARILIGVRTFMFARHGLMTYKPLNTEHEQNPGPWFSRLALNACSTFGFRGSAGLNVDFPTFRQTLQ
jgi:hypothetical protein